MWYYIQQATPHSSCYVLFSSPIDIITNIKHLVWSNINVYHTLIIITRCMSTITSYILNKIKSVCYHIFSVSGTLKQSFVAAAGQHFYLLNTCGQIDVNAGQVFTSILVHTIRYLVRLPLTYLHYISIYVSTSCRSVFVFTNLTWLELHT